MTADLAGAAGPGSVDGYHLLLVGAGPGLGIAVAHRFALGNYVLLPAGTAWRTDPADAAALRASSERTVAVAGVVPGIQPIPAHLP